ncbi:excisionase family DNA-binding protein [Desulfobulbus rhabdoformis]|uniref:excisionase family DNA-binding protein n=1 Tax=Desulfobulbus rhabdoformis TaxID=34032 RepID=UPI0019631D97|nr:excisionase family DNA-binding protein [Desulfobulbus rhabdoformis]
MSILNQKYITYAEAQELYSVGRSRLQRLVVNGVIEAYRPGKETLLDSASLHIWFQSTKIKPVARRGRPRRNAPRK